MEVLKARAKVRSINNDLVFFNRNENRIDARDLLRAFYSATKKAKIENLRWHDATRHTFATRLVQAEVDLYTVQKLGRWKTTQMVMRYAHHYPESLRRGSLLKVKEVFETTPFHFSYFFQFWRILADFGKFFSHKFSHKKRESLSSDCSSSPVWLTRL